MESKELSEKTKVPAIGNNRRRAMMINSTDAQIMSSRIQKEMENERS